VLYWDKSLDITDPILEVLNEESSDDSDEGK
jgi:hypothetical protein